MKTELQLEENPLEKHLKLMNSCAYDYMFFRLIRIQFGSRLLRNFHQLFYSGISESKVGVYRTIHVVITDSSYSVCVPDEIGQEI